MCCCRALLRIDLLHPHYRKLCNIMADIDEWGQVMLLSTLQRYARTQFVDPTPEGTALGDGGGGGDGAGGNGAGAFGPLGVGGGGGMLASRPVPNLADFYSDDEDKEDVDGDKGAEQGDDGKDGRKGESAAAAAGDGDAPTTADGADGADGGDGGGGGGEAGGADDSRPSGPKPLDFDHKLLLNSAMQLLKSRNSAVVLAVASAVPSFKYALTAT